MPRMSIWLIIIKWQKEQMMEMFNPPHPGEIIREDCLVPLELSVTDAAKGLGVTRKALSDVLNGHSCISPLMSIRLEKAGWMTADHWLRLQLQYDLWHAKRRAKKLKVIRFRPPAGHASTRMAATRSRIISPDTAFAPTPATKGARRGARARC